MYNKLIDLSDYTVCISGLFDRTLLHHNLIISSSVTDPTAELQIARRKIHEVESLNKHIQAEVQDYISTGSKPNHECYKHTHTPYIYPVGQTQEIQ